MKLIHWGQVGVGLVFAYLCFCLLLRWGQTRLMFFPSPVLQSTPAAVGLSYEESWLSVPPGQVQTWWIPAQPNAPVILYFHGNASNLGDLVHRAERFHRLGFSTLLIDYRGYGKSWGVFPSESSVYEDAAASWQHLTQTRQIPPERIFLYGQSIGGAVAIELAVRHPEAAGVLVESSFTSMREMVERSIPTFLLPIDWLLTQHFDSLTKVQKLQMPILLMHGTVDDTVPTYMGQALFDAAPEPKQLLLIPNADHNNLAGVGGDLYLQTIHKFVQQSLEANINE